jgi:hypothetical protein
MAQAMEPGNISTLSIHPSKCYAKKTGVLALHVISEHGMREGHIWHFSTVMISGSLGRSQLSPNWLAGIALLQF